MNSSASSPIEEFLPHRLRMRLVEEILSVDDDVIETSSVVRDTWPTVQNGQASTLMLTELIAQSAAVLMGWRDKSHGQDQVGGLLVGVPRARFHRSLIPVGTTVRCRVRISHGVKGYCAFDGTGQDDQGLQWIAASIQAVSPDAEERDSWQHPS
jgi:predicted hotdog family 3-hydroxylacyl-ACP dehydratase